ncbi:hypothetical protein Emin_1021 [Elusimicrobium minutum Pei191]|uniref:Alginate export domain-containing protein n=1 Tax=Elusimicrobium minutum (strain Pei191) TaxID=445932 RepID=B2KDH8_ELUMP|nr:hypothetical protein [Elusimicrobium minutum]ACC98574.1 hypothetical protein Emin_1021 [Elusimicrobium minutum Pei191]
MARYFIYILCIFFPSTVFSGTFNTEFWLNSNASVLNNIPGYSQNENKMKNLNTNIFLSAGYSPVKNIYLDMLASAKQNYYYNEFDSNNSYKGFLHKGSVTLGNETAALTAGRIFYGEKNTLTPYFGLYDNFFGHTASSLNGFKADLNTGWVSLALLAGKENDDFTENSKSEIYGASLHFKPSQYFDINPFVYQLKDSDIDYFYTKIDRQILGAASNIYMGMGMNFYLSYAKNSGEDTYFSSYKFKNKGDAWLAKFNAETENKIFRYNLRFMYVRSSGEKFNSTNSTFKGINTYVYLGSIFSGTDMFWNSPYSRFTQHPFGNIDNITAYNLGATVAPKFTRFFKIDFDIYNISKTKMPYQQEDIGAEMDIALTLMPFKNVDLSLIYAVFYPGNAYKEAIPSTPGYEVNNIKQLAARLNIRF